MSQEATRQERRAWQLPPVGGNPSSTAQGTSPGSFAARARIGSPVPFGSPDAPGMPAPSDITGASPNAVALLLKILRASIEKYEPRLKDVEIAHVEGADEILTLRFQITARIEGAPDGSSISFDTVVDPGGRCKVQV